MTSLSSTPPLSSSPAIMSKALTYLEREPRRIIVAFFVRWYPLIFGLFVTLILAISVGPYNPWWAGVGILSYWCYHFIKRRRWGRPVFGVPYHSPWLQFLRSTLLSAGIALFVGYLYTTTPYLEQVGPSDTLWLLFLLPVFVMSQRSVTWLMVAITGVTLAIFILLTLITAPYLNEAVVQNLLIKVLWLILLPFIVHVLVHFIGDWYARVRMLYDVEKHIMRFRSVSDEPRLIETVVKAVADQFNYPHVNILAARKSALFGRLLSPRPSRAHVPARPHSRTWVGRSQRVASAPCHFEPQVRNPSKRVHKATSQAKTARPLCQILSSILNFLAGGFINLLKQSE